MTGFYNGDFKDLIIKVKDNSIDLIVTDPPYKTTKRGNSGGTGGMCKDTKFIKGNGGMKNNDIKFSEWLPECFRVLKKESHAYFFTNNKNLKNMLIEVENAGFKIFKTLIWAKDNCITNMWYMDSHEYIIFARKGKAVKINNCGTRSVLNIPNVKNKKHPNEKPVELLDILIKNSSKVNTPNFIVFDPFAGTGSTLISASNNGLDYLGFEIDEEIFRENIEYVQSKSISLPTEINIDKFYDKLKEEMV